MMNVENDLQFLKAKQDELNIYMLGKKNIYLDVNYWITLQRQSLETEPSKRILYDTVANLVKLEKAAFPISLITFLEILKNSQIESLRHITKVIDDFSKGISLVEENELRFIEVEIFYNKHIKTKDEIKERPIWTKVSFLAYLKFVNHKKIKKEFDSLKINKFWDLTFSEILEILNKHNYPSFAFKDKVEYFESVKKEYQDENKSFNQMFLSELAGTIRLFDNIFGEVIGVDFFEKTGVYALEKGINESGIKLREIAFRGFESKIITTELPSFRIFAGLFANNRWNKNKKHHVNDTMDFFHACFALPYCDFFFTEKGLATTLKQNNLGYDKLYNCTVLYKENEVLEELNKLLCY